MYLEVGRLVRVFLLFAVLAPCAVNAADFNVDAKPLVMEYCVHCHAGDEAYGQLDLQAISAGNVTNNYKAWESVADRLRSREMPPEDEAQPTEEERLRFLDWYNHTLVNSVEPRPARLRPRRLCAVEYRNTMKSLFGFDLEVAIIKAEQTVVEKSLVMKLLPTDPPGKSGFRNDTHAAPITTDFAHQWLTLGEVEKSNVEVPQAEALRSQPRDFMHYLFVEDRPLIELIDSRIAFANPYTKGYYGEDSGQMRRYQKAVGIEREIVPNQKITLVKTTNRGGILTMPGILAMNRGPILRGVWILERILGEHLPEPPPDVGQVPQAPSGVKLTFRQRFEQHRSNAACAVCHNRIDPLGFALQRYNGAQYEDSPRVDTTGQLPSGEKFDDFPGLKQILVTSQRRRVIRNIVERTLSYALCRKLELFDRPTVDTITDKLHESNGTYRDLLFEVAMSPPFRETIIKERLPSQKDSNK